MALALRRHRRAREGRGPTMGVTPSALPFAALRRVLEGRVACFWEPGGAQGVEEGAREAETLPCRPPWPRAHRAVCASLAPRAPLHMAVAGGWWLCLGALRLLPPPGEGAESRAEWVIIDRPAPGWPKPVPSIPGVTRSWSRGMGRAKQRQLGGGQWGRDRQLSPVLPPGSS